MGLFSTLGMDALGQIAQRCALREARAGTTILSQQDASTDLFILLEGSVAVRSFSSNGREISYSEIAAGEIFGEFAALDDQARSAGIVAIDDSRLAILSAQDFRQAILDYPEIGLRLSQSLVAKNRLLTARVFEAGTMTVRGRLCSELNRLAALGVSGIGKSGEGSITIANPPSHYELAARIGTHREAVSKELGALSRAGIIDHSRQVIRIRDRDALLAVIEASKYR